MKHLTLILMTSIILWSCNEKQKTDYPVTEKNEVKETYFGEEVIDNYRWLEDDNSDETTDWVKAQNNFTFNYLNNIPFRNIL